MAGKHEKRAGVRDDLLRDGAKKWMRGEIDALKSIDTAGIALSPETDAAIRAAMKRGARRSRLGSLWRGVRNAAGFMTACLSSVVNGQSLYTYLFSMSMIRLISSLDTLSFS